MVYVGSLQTSVANRKRYAWHFAFITHALFIPHFYFLVQAKRYMSPSFPPLPTRMQAEDICMSSAPLQCVVTRFGHPDWPWTCSSSYVWLPNMTSSAHHYATTDCCILVMWPGSGVSVLSFCFIGTAVSQSFQSLLSNSVCTYSPAPSLSAWCVDFDWPSWISQGVESGTLSQLDNSPLE